MQFAGKRWNIYLHSKREGRKHTAFPQIKSKRIFAIRFATCSIIRDPPASGSFLMIFHNRVAASQLIRSGLYHS